jgi:hypothetical protein
MAHRIRGKMGRLFRNRIEEVNARMRRRCAG